MILSSFNFEKICSKKILTQRNFSDYKTFQPNKFLVLQFLQKWKICGNEHLKNLHSFSNFPCLAYKFFGYRIKKIN